jgi:ABC-type glycerol-3-phosphate transport system substrate-binding protein
MLLSRYLRQSASRFKLAGQWLPILLGLCLALTLTVGCEKKPTQIEDEGETQVDIPDPLVVLVVGEPELGTRIVRQWSARRDGEVTIIDQTIGEFAAGDFALSKSVDVIIYPPSMMGELVSRKRLRVIPNDFLNSDEYNKIGLLRHFRTSIVRHRNESWAVPLGSPNFAMLTNRSLFEQIAPPETWDQMDRTLVKVAAAIDADPADTRLEPKLDMPLAKGWAAQTFLARVAPSICYRGKLSTVLDRSTVQPLINEAPFVEALEQLVAIASKRSSELDPAEVFELANTGRSAIAFSWPALGFNVNAGDLESGNSESGSRLEDEPAGSNSEQDRLRISPLPGMEKWFDQKTGAWIKRAKEDDPRVDLVGFSGLVASVSATCPNERSAWDFLQWLPSKSISKLTMVESPVVGPFRASHLGDMSRWTGESVSEDVAFEYGDVIAANHERSLSLMFPRIPGSSRYFDALDHAVRSAISGEQSPQAALSAAAKIWNEISNEIGRDRQVSNLRKERGL